MGDVTAVLRHCDCKRRPGASEATIVWGKVPALCPVHGDPENNKPCGRCNGCGIVSGEGRDDPKYWPCVSCHGTGLFDAS